jgi:hypothetical protein
MARFVFAVGWVATEGSGPEAELSSGGCWVRSADMSVEHHTDDTIDQPAAVAQRLLSAPNAPDPRPISACGSAARIMSLPGTKTPARYFAGVGKSALLRDILQALENLRS